jgi:hypothetical protein
LSPRPAQLLLERVVPCLPGWNLASFFSYTLNIFSRSPEGDFVLNEKELEWMLHNHA